MTKKNLMPAIVLSAICIAAALLLSVINIFTGPRIADNKEKKAIGSLIEVLPGATGKVDLTIDERYPDAIKKGYKFDNGFVFHTDVKGYASGLEILCGIDLDGKVVGVKHIESNETYGFESQLNGAYIGKDINSAELIIASGATQKSATSKGYYTAITAALQAFEIANDRTVDTRTPEQILQDNCNAALGTTGKTFVRFFESYKAFGDAKIYTCDSGAVIVSGESFVGYLNGSTSPVGTPDADAISKTAEAYTAYTALEKIDFSLYASTAKSVKSVYKNTDGEYIISLSRKGFSYSEAPMVIEVFIKDGVITSCVTVSHTESGGYGAACGSPEYYEQYVGKTADTYNTVPNIIATANGVNPGLTGGATQTSNGYKLAIADAFAIIKHLQEGGND